MTAPHAEQTDSPPDWTDADDWTPEALALLRTLRAPHRRGRAKQVLFLLYCVVLVLVIWGGVPSLGLFLQAKMGADYTAHGGRLLAALPSGIAAVSLATFLVVLRDALWRGPVVPPRASIDWLLIHPVRPRPVLRPWFWLSCGLAAFPGLVTAVGAMVALGLMVKVGLAAAFGWCLVGCLCVPLLATSAAVWVERSDRAARWVRRLSGPVLLAVLGLAAQCGLAIAGDRVGWLERGELWSGPWGWAGITALAPTRASVPGAWAAAALLLIGTLGALVLADRAASTVPLDRLRERARTAAGVLAALRTVELRSARLAVSSAAGAKPRHRLRLPAPRSAWLVIPWRDATALLRAPARLGRAVLLTGPALLAAVPAHTSRGPAGWLATGVAVVFGYLAVAQLLEPARVEADDLRRSSWSPYRITGLMLRHAVVPVLLGGLIAVLAALGVELAGGGPAVWLAPVLVPALVAAGLVNACRGVPRRDLIVSPLGGAGGGAGGGLGPLVFAAWYAAGPAVAVVVLAAPLSDAVRTDSNAACVPVAGLALALAGVLGYWAWDRAGKLRAAN
ncbi:hypothetical protein [Kitasatospora viridis]|uniref:ABC-2 type transport system permease protein n=1 Tax=Kitasatospora viridis TaxID=281105 RepID=A0A561UBY1_9ACTN|nr:hypothetical protein [Kitasatospora viridis]TWF96849.1 hypothetical protein FHX73_11622 [Kitasatospora viridis]